jgi:hypothetical protein
MARNPRDVLKFLLDNLEPLLEISRERRRFSSADDIAIPFRHSLDDGAHIGKRISDMKQLGILIPAAGEWVMPAYVRDFLQRLQEHHAATAPGIVKAIVSQLQETTAGLADALDHPDAAGSATRVEGALREACELFYDAVDRLEQTCLAIEAEVAKYRAARDSREVKESLRHLLGLYENYLHPLVDVIDLNGLFVVTSNRLLTCCERLLAEPAFSTALAEQARLSHDTVLWQRQRTLQYTASVRHELEPLYQIALRDSKIARGINRVHALYANDKVVGLLALARIEDSKEATFFCDESVRNEFRRLRNYKPPLPPLLTPFTPSPWQLPPQYRQLRDELLDEPFVPDVFNWFRERCGTANADHVLRCVSRLYFDSSEYMTARDQRNSYEFDAVTVEACLWEWRSSDGNNR